MKIGILYASKYGSTAECAKRIAAELRDEATTVELVSLQKNPRVDIVDYDFIILGSGAYGGTVMAPMREFCAANLARLMEKKVALFFCGIFEGDKLAAEKLVAYPTSLQAHAVAYEFFGGEIDFEKLGFFARQFVKAFGIKESFSTIDQEKINRFIVTISKVSAGQKQ